MLLQSALVLASALMSDDRKSVVSSKSSQDRKAPSDHSVFDMLDHVCLRRSLMGTLCYLLCTSLCIDTLIHSQSPLLSVVKFCHTSNPRIPRWTFQRNLQRFCIFEALRLHPISSNSSLATLLFFPSSIAGTMSCKSPEKSLSSPSGSKMSSCAPSTVNDHSA